MIELLRTFAALLRTPSRRNEPLDLFLGGATIPGAASAANPGMGGPALVEAQRVIEAEIRAFVIELEHENRELKRALALARAA